MTRHLTIPKKCRRGHIFIKDKFLLWHPNNQSWTIIKNCKYCIDAKRIEDQIEGLEDKVKRRHTREERLLQQIFGERKPSRFRKIKT